MKKTWLNDCVFDFTVDNDDIAVDFILEIHKDLMKKNNMISKRLDLLKQCLL